MIPTTVACNQFVYTPSNWKLFCIEHGTCFAFAIIYKYMLNIKMLNIFIIKEFCLAFAESWWMPRIQLTCEIAKIYAAACSNESAKQKKKMKEFRMGKSHLTAGFVPTKASCNLWHFHIQYMKEYYRNVVFFFSFSLETTTITNRMEKLQICADWDVFIRATMNQQPTVECREWKNKKEKRNQCHTIE